MVIHHIQGDLLESDCTIIGHQANCKNKMGGGIALQIKRKYPEVYQADTQAYIEGLAYLGNYSKSYTRDGKLVYNLYGQQGYGRGKQTEEARLKEAIDKMLHDVINEQKIKEYKLGLPYEIGCGLGGGIWGIVYKDIEELSKKYNIDIYLYEYRG